MMVEDNSLAVSPGVVADVVDGGFPVLDQLHDVTGEFA